MVKSAGQSVCKDDQDGHYRDSYPNVNQRSTARASFRADLSSHARWRRSLGLRRSWPVRVRYRGREAILGLRPRTHEPIAFGNGSLHQQQREEKTYLACFGWFLRS